MTVPLMILAVLSVVGGWIGWPESLGGSDHFAHFLDPVIAKHAEVAAVRRQRAHGTEYALMTASVLVALFGIWLAWKLYLQQPDMPGTHRGDAGAGCTGCSTTSITWTRFTTRCS